MTTPSYPRRCRTRRRKHSGPRGRVHASHNSHNFGPSRHLIHPLMPFPVAVAGAVRPRRGVWQETGRLLSKDKLGTGGFLPLPERGRAWQQESETLAAGLLTGALRCSSLSALAERHAEPTRWRHSCCPFGRLCHQRLAVHAQRNGHQRHSIAITRFSKG